MKNLFAESQEFGSISPELAKSLSGLDVCQKMIDGELPLPPMYRLMNIALLECSEGRTYLKGRPSADHCNPMATVHGGWFATVLDAAMASAVHTMLPAGAGHATVEFKVNVVRPLRESTGDVFCEGKVIHFGRTIATSEARLLTEAGKLLAHSVETCSIFSAVPRYG